ncbi:MAG: hypothetical protein Q8L85_01745 [Alphaproteobacteria bacterium]|nr:hypothetical protein [Alphaproteobacteria bacterium]
MKKTAFLMGAILIALNMQPLYAGLTDEENKKVCKQKWGTRAEIVGEHLKIEKAYEKARPGENEKRTERIEVFKSMLLELEEALDYCIENGEKNAGIAYSGTILDYNNLFIYN